MVPSLEITSGPAVEPITLSEVNDQIRVNNPDEADLLTTYISAARLAFERLTHGRILIATTFKEYVPTWGPCNVMPYDPYPYRSPYYAVGWRPLRLSRGKVSSITSITYYDTLDASQNLTGHNIDLTGVPALVRMQTAVWPALSPQRARPITVTYVAGYANAAAVPADIKLALLSLVASWYWTRESYAEGDMMPVPMAFEDFASMHDTGIGAW